MPYYFMRDTPLQALEQLIRSLSNKIPALFSFQRGVRLCRTISCETRRCRR